MYNLNHYIPMFLLRRYGFFPLTVSFFMVVRGVGFGYLVDFLTKRYLMKWGAVVTMLISCVCSLLIVAIDSTVLPWFLVLIMGAFISVAYAVMISIFSNQVPDSQQGWIMGITGSIMALSFGVIGLLSALLTDYSPNIPLVVSVVCLVLGAGLKAINPQA